MHGGSLVGLDPVIGERTEVLILGTFPGEESLLKRQYYADATNDFWKILEAAVDEQITRLTYDAKLQKLLAHGVGLWDVYHSCDRAGSADGGISNQELNDFESLRKKAPSIKLIIFNGKKPAEAADEYLRRQGYATRVCPSSSGANRRDQEGRIRSWKESIADANEKEPMTTFQNLHLEIKNHIAYVTIDRPKVLNALSMATMDELRQAFAAAKDDAEVRVVILTGAGEKAFVALALTSANWRSSRPSRPRSTPTAARPSSTPSRTWASRSSPASTASRSAEAASWRWPAPFAWPATTPSSASPKSSSV